MLSYDVAGLRPVLVGCQPVMWCGSPAGPIRMCVYFIHLITSRPENPQSTSTSLHFQTVCCQALESVPTKQAVA